MNEDEVRVLIADDQPQARSALRLLLQVKLGAATIGCLACGTC